MTKTATSRYDVAEHLRTPEEMAAYLEACLEEADGDAAFVAKALGDLARGKGMTQVARDAGLSRERLYKALSGERSPSFDTILKVIGTLGSSFTQRPVTPDEGPIHHARFIWRQKTAEPRDRQSAQPDVPMGDQLEYR